MAEDFGDEAGQKLVDWATRVAMYQVRIGGPSSGERAMRDAAEQLTRALEVARVFCQVNLSLSQLRVCNTQPAAAPVAQGARRRARDRIVAALASVAAPLVGVAAAVLSVVLARVEYRVKTSVPIAPSLRPLDARPRDTATVAGLLVSTCRSFLYGHALSKLRYG